MFKEFKIHESIKFKPKYRKKHSIIAAVCPSPKQQLEHGGCSIAGPKKKQTISCKTLLPYSQTVSRWHSSGSTLGGQEEEPLLPASMRHYLNFIECSETDRRCMFYLPELYLSCIIVILKFTIQQFLLFCVTRLVTCFNCLVLLLLLLECLCSMS
jgi:hypothetical protein